MISERLKLQPVYKEFVRELKQGRLSNAYLFVGEDSLTGEAMLSEAEAAIMRRRPYRPSGRKRTEYGKDAEAVPEI